MPRKSDKIVRIISGHFEGASYGTDPPASRRQSFHWRLFILSSKPMTRKRKRVWSSSDLNRE